MNTQSSGEPALDETADPLRKAARDILKSNTQADMRLVWVLGEIHGGKAYKTWGFHSFRDWYNAEGDGSPSLSHAYALARIGKVFFGQREEIEKRVQAGELTIRDLMDLAQRYEEGEKFGEGAKEATGDAVPKEKKPREPDTEKPRYVMVRVPDGDLNNVIAGLTMEALSNNVSTVSDAVRARGVENYLFGMSPTSDFKNLSRYKDLILGGRFFCAACNKIPLTPTFHHILPVSIGRGYGPQALLCWDPCHEHDVQPHWREWANRWGKKYGFTVASLKAEAEKQINSGEVDCLPTLIITGTCIGIK